VPAKSAASYIEEISDPNLRRLAKRVRSIVRKSIPDADESLKMGAPCYSINGQMVALIGDYKKHINLYFFEGARLSSDLLEGTGKGMRHIKIAAEPNINPTEFSRLLKEAAKNAEKTK
jgi:hypothetical protein